MEVWVEIAGFVRDKEDLTPFSLIVEMPVKTKGYEEFSCTVRAPALLENEKQIFGATEEQAQELAAEFVRSLLKRIELVDKDGNLLPLVIPRIA